MIKRCSSIYPGVGTMIPYPSTIQAGLTYIPSVSYITATGGIITNIGDYTIHTFTTGGTFTVINGGGIDVLVVAGGGAGGATMGGGGGAGGVISQSGVKISSGSYSVTVGVGGTAKAGTGNNGGNSIFDTLVAIGGGGGGNGGTNVNGVSGGSGGGTSFQTGTVVAGLGTPGQGHDGGVGAGVWNTGGCGGGGGGASVAGSTGVKSVSGGKGGDGLLSNISGVSAYYGGGGGGGGNNYSSSCAGGGGGLGGGGAGGKNTAGVTGTANTGGGGGGGGYNGTTFDCWGGNGGSGIVIIRYKNSRTNILDSFSSSTELFILPNTNNLTDRSPNNWSLSQSNLTISSNPLWNGYYSINNPNGTGRWTGPANTLLQPGSGTFTIDSILVLTGNTYNQSGTNARLIGCEASYQNAWYFDFISTQNGFPTGIIFGSSSLGVSYSWNYSFVINTTYHVAVQRIGTKLSLWVNGVKQNTTYNTNSNFNNNTYGISGMSRNDSYTEGLRCNVYMLRMVKDAALFTSNFTPDFNIIPKLI